MGGGTLYDWLTGEAYVLDPELRPTADRRDFKESEAKERLLSLLRGEFQRLNRLIDRRRAALLETQNAAGDGDREKLNRAVRTLIGVGKDLGAEPAFSFTELLDERGRDALQEHEQSGLAAPEPEEAEPGSPEAARSVLGPDEPRSPRAHVGVPTAAAPGDEIAEVEEADPEHRGVLGRPPPAVATRARRGVPTT